MSGQANSNRNLTTKIEAELPEYLKMMVETQGTPIVGDHLLNADHESSMGENSKRNTSFDFTREYKFNEENGVPSDKQSPVMFADLVQIDKLQNSTNVNMLERNGNPSLSVLKTIIDQQLHELKNIHLQPAKESVEGLKCLISKSEIEKLEKAYNSHISQEAHRKSNRGRDDHWNLVDSGSDRELNRSSLPAPEELLLRVKLYTGNPGVVYNTTLSEIVEETSDVLLDTKSSDTLRNYQLINNFIYDPESQNLEADKSASRTAKLSPRNDGRSDREPAGGKEKHISLRTITGSTPNLKEKFGRHSKGKGMPLMDMSPKFNNESNIEESPEEHNPFDKTVYATAQGSRDVQSLSVPSTPQYPGQVHIPSDTGMATAGGVMKTSDLRSAIKTKMANINDADRFKTRDVDHHRPSLDDGKIVSLAQDGPREDKRVTDEKGVQEKVHRSVKNLREISCQSLKGEPVKIGSIKKDIPLSSPTNLKSTIVQKTVNSNSTLNLNTSSPKPKFEPNSFKSGLKQKEARQENPESVEAPIKKELVHERLRTKANKYLEQEAQTDDNSKTEQKSGNRSISKSQQKDIAIPLYYSTSDMINSGREKQGLNIHLVQANPISSLLYSQTKPKIRPTKVRHPGEVEGAFSSSNQIKKLVQDNLDISKSFDLEHEYKLQRANISNHLHRINFMLNQISEVVPKHDSFAPSSRLDYDTSPFSRPRRTIKSRDSRTGSISSKKNGAVSEKNGVDYFDYFKGTLESAVERVAPLGFSKKAFVQSTLSGLVGSNLKKRVKEPIMKNKLNRGKPFSNMGSVISQAQSRAQKKRSVKPHMAAKSADAISRVKFSTASKGTAQGTMEESSHVSIDSNMKNGPMFRTLGTIGKQSPVNGMKISITSNSKSNGQLMRGNLRDFDFLSNCKTQEECKPKLKRKDKHMLSNNGVRQGLLFGLTLKSGIGKDQKFASKKAIFRKETG